MKLQFFFGSPQIEARCKNNAHDILCIYNKNSETSSLMNAAVVGKLIAV